jgi:integrase
MNLTDGTVRKLNLGADEPDGKIHFDDKISGLGVRLYRSGRAVWVYQFRLAGRSHKLEIGSTNKIVANVARSEARIAAGHVAKGENPIDLRRKAEARHKDQFGELAKAYLEEKLDPIVLGKRPMRPRSYSEVKRHLEHHCRSLTHRAIKSITQEDIASLYRKISRAHGPGAASHTWSTLRAFLHWCMRQGVLETNVAALYQGAGASEPRNRTLGDAELAIVWQGCGDDQFGTIVKLLILTGARRDEVGHMHLDELALRDNPEWLLPADRAKNSREHLIPLSQPAVDLLAKAIETRDAYVFGYGNKRGFSGWSKAKAALDKRIADAGHKIEPWTLHDLRRGFAAGLQRLKVKPHVVEACLNHAPPKLQRTYQTHDYEKEQRAALDRWAKHVLVVVAP